MIKLTYDQITDKNFLQALHALGSASNVTSQVAHRISKVTGPIRKKLDALQKEFQPIMDEYTEKGPDGKPVFNKEAQGYKVEDSKKEGLKAAREEFGARTFELDARKLTFKELGSVQLSPDALTALGPILELLDEDTGPNLSVVS